MNPILSSIRSFLNRSETTTHNGAQEPSAARTPASPSASRLANMPNELLRPIARLVPPEDRQNLLLTTRRFVPVIGEDVRSGMLAVKHVPKVKNFNQFKTALDEIQKFSRSCRQEPLLPLASQIEHLPEEDRENAFNKLFKAIGELMAVDQPSVLSNLASQICMLPPDKRSAAFRKIFDAIDKLPARGRADVLSSLASRAVSSLPESDQNTTIDDLHKAADALPASHRSKVQESLNAMQFVMMVDMQVNLMMQQLQQQLHMAFRPFGMG
ncbi:hypothetical protein [Mycetohabitans rhizoxinica]|uniref:hypothetical protein n=1 Tax=Mycetohabitans rhizoxinica TaxID=412963 RepID=UPI0030D34BE3